MVSKITDKIIPQINEWKNGPLEPICPFIFLNAIHYKVREDGRIKNKAAYSNSEIQRCIIHQLRNSFKYVNYKDLRQFVDDFREVYKAANEKVGYQKLLEPEEKWGKKYSYVFKSWDMNWDVLSPFFKYPSEIRRIMYTTNIIEGVYRQFRKVAKTKSVFPTDFTLEKILYLTSQNVMRKWNKRYRNWDSILNQLLIFFEGRVEPYL